LLVLIDQASYAARAQYNLGIFFDGFLQPFLLKSSPARRFKHVGFSRQRFFPREVRPEKDRTKILFQSGHARSSFRRVCYVWSLTGRAESIAAWPTNDKRLPRCMQSQRPTQRRCRTMPPSPALTRFARNTIRSLRADSRSQTTHDLFAGFGRTSIQARLLTKRISCCSLGQEREILCDCHAGDGGRANHVGLALRFALSAPPLGLRRAALQAKATTRNNENKTSKRGHF
jgi:hypothetical protein